MRKRRVKERSTQIMNTDKNQTNEQGSLNKKIMTYEHDYGVH